MKMLIVFSALSLALAGASEDDWTALTDKGPVQTARLKVADSAHHAYRARGQICASQEQMMALFDDPQQLTTWLPRTESVEVLEAEPLTKLVYVVSSAPWPMRSRDLVYRISAETNADITQATVQVQGLPDHLPSQKGLVRLAGAAGHWRMAFSEGSVDAEFILHLEMGRVPAFVAGRTVHHAVRDAIRNLQARHPCAELSE